MTSNHPKPQASAKRTWPQRFKDHLPTLFVLLGIATFRTAVADWSHIPSSSMEPNFFPGDYIWVEKFSYGPSIPLLNRRLPGWGSPERGDIVTFLPPHTDDVYIKRVIGVPGDQVVIRGAEVSVNGQLLPTRFEQQPDGDIAATQRLGDHEYSILYSARLPIRPGVQRYVVPPGQYFMMGDHRNNSEDSRVWGFASEDRILGRVTHIAVSFADERPWRERFALRVSD